MVATDLASDAGTAMALVPKSSFTDNKSSGDQTLYVGGTLTVGATQNAGLYEGTVEVTVSYE
ncbi:hypothetical protein GCM10007103_10820 [Salinimicrobium marinum]|uniref:DUF4402 domain-containing protein n=2 Tax=Salinimicrobium marinum TaxID=680283 RepID=A0A918VWF3_9FLAO|nr:hypothetical protein GCM10007103_10820 [Salinimicrobium marinum]